jgi:hypothetical protein
MFVIKARKNVGSEKPQNYTERMSEGNFQLNYEEISQLNQRKVRGVCTSVEVAASLTAPPPLSSSLKFLITKMIIYWG